MTRSILDLRICLWAPMDPQQDPYVARLEQAPGKYLPILFEAPTAMKAKRAAEDWRREEVEKLQKAEENKVKRVAAMQAARAAKAEAPDAAA
ncbi:MAG: hypothetical protein KDK24_10120 [Pseudooceanicola sp.]|nr:hypothetical protein [Pseudooceanicola sp.]